LREPLLFESNGFPRSSAAVFGFAEPGLYAQGNAVIAAQNHHGVEVAAAADWRQKPAAILGSIKVGGVALKPLVIIKR
jgi:hypothetical protein